MESQNLVIVGLGNPGPRYDGTRHNIGFAVVDALLQSKKSKDWTDISTELKPFAADAVSGRFDIDGWHDRGSFLEASVSLGGVKAHLIKPRTFMNRSGEPLRDFLSFRKLSLTSTLVIHDEIDLPTGIIRVKVGGGEGGHNGLRSIVSACGGNEFGRVRVGVGKPPPGSPILDSEDGIAKWVLSQFSRDEALIIQDLVARAGAAAVCLATKGLAVSQNKFNS